MVHTADSVKKILAPFISGSLFCEFENLFYKFEFDANYNLIVRVNSVIRPID